MTKDDTANFRTCTKCGRRSETLIVDRLQGLERLSLCCKAPLKVQSVKE